MFDLNSLSLLSKRMFRVISVIMFVSGCGEAPQPETQVVADPNFSPIQVGLLASGGTFTNAWADIDGDGDSDLFVGFNGMDRLYQNDQGVLVNVAEQLGIMGERTTRTSAWGDYDQDGDPDLFLGFVKGDFSTVTALFRNDGNRFVEVSNAVGLQLTEGSTRQATWVDFDADKDLDLFLALRDRGNALFRNDQGQFHDVAAEVGVADSRRTVGALWFDYEQDGDLDLLVANMDGDANGLFRNDQGHFTDVAENAGIADGGRGLGNSAYGTVRPCVIDYDLDGLMDLFMTNYGPNALFHNEGDGRFRNVAEEMGVATDSRYDSCAFGDYDLDGRIDLYVNGTVSGGKQYRDYLFRLTSSGFIDVTPMGLRELNADHGAQWIDFDQDGDLDLSLTGANSDGMHYVMRNSREDYGGGTSIQVSVVDAESNATQVGAEVRIYRADTNELLGFQIVDSGSGYNSQNVTPVHFGLSDNGQVDVEVIFPNGGRRDKVGISRVDPVGQIVTIRAEH
jgi:hypothetical protein